MLRGRSESAQGRSEDAQRTLRGAQRIGRGCSEDVQRRLGGAQRTLRSAHWTLRGIQRTLRVLRGRSEDVQATLRGRSEDVQRRSGAFRGLLETPPPPPLGISSLREFALCNSRYPPTRACGWVVGSRPDGDAITGMAGMTGTASCLSKSLVLSYVCILKNHHF